MLGEEKMPPSAMPERQVLTKIGIYASDRASEELEKLKLTNFEAEPSAVFTIIDDMRRKEDFPFQRVSAAENHIEIKVVDGSELGHMNFGLFASRSQTAGYCNLTEASQEKFAASIQVASTINGSFVGNKSIHRTLVHELQHAHDLMHSYETFIEDVKVQQKVTDRFKLGILGASLLYFTGNSILAEEEYDITNSMPLSASIGMLGGLAAWQVIRRTKTIKGEIWRAYYKRSPLEIRARKAAIEADRYPIAINIC